VTRRRYISSVKLWTARWGFAALVSGCVVAAFLVGATVAIPADIPTVALRAAAIYRLEVSGAFFAGLYITAVALVLALQNRAFTQFGTGGIRARSLIDLPTTLRTNERALKGLLEVLNEIWDLRDDSEEE
jgi:hypothetical protein